MADILYIKAPRITEVNKKDVYLADVADLYCADHALLAKCRTLKVLTVNAKKHKLYVCSMVEIVELIHKIDPKIEINNLGEQDFIVDYQYPPKKIIWFDWVKTGLVCLITFVGAAFAIMTFNNDTSVTDVFANIYKLVTGEESNGFTVLEISYSIGLPLGIVIFFNHISKKALSTDPTPMEVQMRLYEKDVDDAIIHNSERKETGVDVS